MRVRCDADRVWFGACIGPIRWNRYTALAPRVDTSLQHLSAECRTTPATLSEIIWKYVNRKRRNAWDRLFDMDIWRNGYGTNFGWPGPVSFFKCDCFHWALTTLPHIKQTYIRIFRLRDWNDMWDPRLGPCVPMFRTRRWLDYLVPMLHVCVCAVRVDCWGEWLRIWLREGFCPIPIFFLCCRSIGILLLSLPVLLVPTLPSSRADDIPDIELPNFHPSSNICMHSICVYNAIIN